MRVRIPPAPYIPTTDCRSNLPRRRAFQINPQHLTSGGVLLTVRIAQAVGDQQDTLQAEASGGKVFVQALQRSRYLRQEVGISHRLLGGDGAFQGCFHLTNGKIGV